MNPTTLQELITLLTQIMIENGGETPIEFQDYDEENREIEIMMENNICYTDSSESTKKLCIRYL